MKKIISAFLILLLSATFLYADDKAAEEKKEEEGNFFVVVPVVTYSPETSFNFQVVSMCLFRIMTDKPNVPSSTLQFSASYSLNNQSKFYLKSDFYFPELDYHGTLTTEYRRQPDSFFGVGNNMPASDEESYLLEAEYVRLEFYRKIVRHFHMGLKYMFQHAVLLEREAGGLFDTLQISGEEGGNEFGLGFTAKWDSRNNPLYPTTGAYSQLSATFYGDIVGSQYRYDKYEADLRCYFETFMNQSLSLQYLFGFQTGEPPFYYLNMMGGNKILRGYYEGRYRDRSIMALQFEYKWVFFNRLVCILHGGLGMLSRDVSGLFSAPVRLSVGPGVRFILDEKSGFTFRLDTGFGTDAFGLYIDAGEAF